VGKGLCPLDFYAKALSRDPVGKYNVLEFLYRYDASSRNDKSLPLLRGKGRAATSPALVSPFGIPLPRRPHCKEWPKGETHPHFGGKGKVVPAFMVPGGMAQSLRGLPFGALPLTVCVFPSPAARKRPR